MKYPLWRELREAYLKGELQRPENNALVYHLNEEREKLGDKYLIWDHWDNFVNGVKLSEEIETIKHKSLWKTA